MKNILQTIITHKRVEVEAQKQAVPLNTLLQLGYDKLEEPTRSMKKSLQNSELGVIAEFKRKSPSKDWINKKARIEEILPDYAKEKAAACSILTDYRFFGGTLNDLKKAHKTISLPLLRKDFIIDPYQLFQSKIMGADAILLIASCLTPQDCRHLAETAHQIGLEVLLEIHTSQEINYVNPHVDMVGINNRNLDTFETDVQNSFSLAAQIQTKLSETKDSQPLLISESGISNAKTIYQLRQAGFRGFLMGETFMKENNPGKVLSNLTKEFQLC